MKRDIYNQLVTWKQHPLRKPLLIRGARQVGKSWIVRKFGEEFEYFIEINFDKDKEAIKLFPESIDIKKIIKSLEYYSKKKAIPGKTLIFLDEIQDCDNALRALRYFKEDYPEIHVIAAGSLLEFAIEKHGLAVGRLQFLFLYPLSFNEFLEASNNLELKEDAVNGDISDLFHEKILEQVKYYSIIGGMPEVVNAWVKYQDLSICQDLQSDIIITYRQDFEKYAKQHQLDDLDTLFNKSPNHIGNKFIYSRLEQHMSAYTVKKMLNLLVKSGILYQCYHSSCQGHPLGADKNHKKFKLFFLDIGLANRILGLDIKEWMLGNVLEQHKGKMAEQFVSQELIAYGNSKTMNEIYYWHREERSSNAEVDFVITKNNKVIPIEVKSGSKGKIRSLNLFLESHKNSKKGLKISTDFPKEYDNYENIPFYSIKNWLDME